jgi:hypothetical protein
MGKKLTDNTLADFEARRHISQEVRDCVPEIKVSSREQTKPLATNSDDRKRDQLALHDKARLASRTDRAARTSIHAIIPDEFFAAASSECRDVFIDGHYYACISLSQAVAEGLAQFLGTFHKVGAKKDPALRVQRLRNKSVITQKALEAFRRIWGNDRNTFHHLNPDITIDHPALELRAEECVKALLEIESEIFAFTFVDDGQIAPKHPEYWPRTDAQSTKVFLRLSGH